MSLHKALGYFNLWRNRLTAKSGSFGNNGLNGILKKECIVCPPTFTAAMPVGARTTYFFLVFEHI